MKAARALGIVALVPGDPETTQLPSEPEGDLPELIDRARAGDAQAQDELFRRHMTGLHAWVRLRQGPLVAARESAMDIVQTVFRQALGDLERFEFRGGNSFRNWLLTYADNKLRNRNQFYKAQRRGVDREVAAPLSQLYATIASPSQVLSAKESVQQFERAFGELAERDRELILLVRIEGLSHAEAGARLGISVDASKKAFSRAMVRLASRMLVEP